MTNEELAQATADEAYRVWCKNPDRTGNSIALIAARLAREGWTPPERVDPDLLAAREWMKRVSAYNHAHIDNGDWDGGDTIRAYLAGCTRGREGAKGLVEALEKQAFVTSKSCGGGAEVIIGFLTIDDAGDAHEALAALASAKRGG